MLATLDLNPDTGPWARRPRPVVLCRMAGLGRFARDLGRHAHGGPADVDRSQNTLAQTLAYKAVFRRISTDRRGDRQGKEKTHKTHCFRRFFTGE